MRISAGFLSFSFVVLPSLVDTITNSVDVAEVEEISEPEFSHHVDHAGISTFEFHPCFQSFLCHGGRVHSSFQIPI